MKKVAFVCIAIAFVLTLLASCNKNVCPAYVQEDDNTEQTDSNS